MMLRAALGAVLLPPLGDGSRVRHIEPIGAGACLVFEKPVLVDRGPSTGRLSAAVAIGSPDNQTFFMPANTYAALGQHEHFHANFGQRLYLSTSGGDSWSRQGEVRPCCAADAPECNTVNVSWFGPLIPCAGTKACGDLPGAERMVYDLGLLQFASRTTGLGPNFTTPWIGLHSVHGNRLEGQVLRRKLQISGLPPLELGNCTRGVDGAPLSPHGMGRPLRLGGRMLLPVKAFVKTQQEGHTLGGTASSGAVCSAHKSSLMLLETEAGDGLNWRVVSEIAAPSHLPPDAEGIPAEGPNECTLIAVPETQELVVIYRHDQLRNNTRTEKERAAYQVVRSSTGGRTWSKPRPMNTDSGEPMLAVQPAGIWLSATQNTPKVLALVGGRPGLHLWTSIDGRATNWSHDCNLAAIHNTMISDPQQRFSDNFVASQVMDNRVEDSHNWRMVRRGDDRDRFAIAYERLHLGKRNKLNYLFFMRGQLATCSALSDV